MGEQGFDFHVSQGFHSPQAALLLKARYLEGKQDMDSFEPSDFVFLNAESDELSGDDQKMKMGSSSPPNADLRPADLPKPIPSSSSSSSSNLKDRKRKLERAVRYAFKTRSESDILEDGYKWRKYGRKSVKNSPNPRNYYRCSNDNCNVKKRVERDAHDKGIVVTTYEGKHNHESPSVVYYVGTPSMVEPVQVSPLEYYPPLSYGQANFIFIKTT